MKILKGILILLILSACGPGKNATKLDLKELEREGFSFRIENNWASPMGDQVLNQLSMNLPNGSSSNAINLIGNPNHFEIIGDSLSVKLPYFGVRQMSGGYNRDGGITVKEKFSDLTISSTKKNSKFIKLSAKSTEGENFQFNVQIFENGTTTIYVNASQRSAITYRGEITEWDIKSEQDKTLKKS